jgi:hypothetical protein
MPTPMTFQNTSTGTCSKKKTHTPVHDLLFNIHYMILLANESIDWQTNVTMEQKHGVGLKGPEQDKLILDKNRKFENNC